MAKVLFGDGIVGLSGSTGATTYARNRYGYYRRNKVIPVNPSTPAQQSSRAILAAFSQQWRILTQAQRDAWEGAVENFLGTDVLANVKRLSGSVLYTRLNSVLVSIGQPAITEPPLPSSVPSAQLGAITIDTTTPTYNATYANPGAGFTIQVWATPPVSPGVSYVKNLFKVIMTEAGLTVPPLDFEAAYNAVYGVPAVGTKVFLKMVVVQNATGLRSAPSTGFAIVI